MFYYEKRKINRSNHIFNKKHSSGRFIKPARDALDNVRNSNAGSRNFKMPDFITLGVLRHIQGISTLREQIQSLFHMHDTNVEKLPMARSTMSDALASEKRTVVLHSLIIRFYPF